MYVVELNLLMETVHQYYAGMSTTTFRLENVAAYACLQLPRTPPRPAKAREGLTTRTAGSMQMNSTPSFMAWVPPCCQISVPGRCAPPPSRRH